MCSYKTFTTKTDRTAGHLLACVYVYGERTRSRTPISFFSNRITWLVTLEKPWSGVCTAVRVGKYDDYSVPNDVYRAEHVTGYRFRAIFLQTNMTNSLRMFSLRPFLARNDHSNPWTIVKNKKLRQLFNNTNVVVFINNDVRRICQYIFFLTCKTRVSLVKILYRTRVQNWQSLKAPKSDESRTRSAKWFDENSFNSQSTVI